MDYPACNMCWLRERDPRHTARVKFGNNHYYNFYCREHLDGVIEDMKSLPYVKDEGYTVDYPFKNSPEDKNVKI